MKSLARKSRPRGERARKNASSKLTLADFERTGQQDCNNSFTISDFDIEAHDDAEAVVDAALDEWEMDDWIDQQGDDFDDLDPRKAWKAWLSGYRACAIKHVVDAIEKNREGRRADKVLYYVFDDIGTTGGAEPSGTQLDVTEALEDAIDLAARSNLESVIWIGDGDGPKHRIAFAVPPKDNDILYWEYGDIFGAWQSIAQARVRLTGGETKLHKRFVAARNEMRRQGRIDEIEVFGKQKRKR